MITLKKVINESICPYLKKIHSYNILPALFIIDCISSLTRETNKIHFSFRQKGKSISQPIAEINTDFVQQKP